MKALRNKIVLGLAVGERSLLAAEIDGNDRPVVTRVAEMTYPEGVTPLDTERFGEALAAFRREQQFSARVAVVGLSAKWLVVKTKEVPPTDEAALASLLRLQAEAEFSSELKELVFDFAGAADPEAAKSVLLVATQRKYIEAAVAAGAAARLQVISVTSTALALSEATERSMGGSAMVLVVGARSAELTASRGAAPGVIRHLRGPDPQPPFLSELRRAVSTLPGAGAQREMILWDGTGLDAPFLGQQLGLSVRRGDLPALGVDTASAGINGEGRRYAGAVALALAGREGPPAVDFLHSRLAPPPTRRVPRWALPAALAAAVIIAITTYAFSSLHAEQARLDAMRANLDSQKSQIAEAEAFVSKVQFAKKWHGGDPRYLTCMREVTIAMPDDGVTYATSLILRENAHVPGASAAQNKSVADDGTLAGQLAGKTSEHQRVEQILDKMRHMPAFTEVKLGGATESTRHEVQFSITFTFVPGPAPKAKK